MKEINSRKKGNKLKIENGGIVRCYQGVLG